MYRTPLTRSELALQIILAFARFGIEVAEPEIIAGGAGNWTIGEAQKRENASASAYRRAADEIQSELGAIYRLS